MLRTEPLPPDESQPGFDLTISGAVANTVGVVLSLVVLGGAVGLYLLVWRGWDFTPADGVILMVSLFAGVPLHEALHLLGYVVFGKAPWKALRVGILWKQLTPYAACTVPLPVRAYRRAIVLPGVALGLIPMLLGLLTRSTGLTLGGGFLLGAATGDLLILWLLRSTPSTHRVLDHPDRIGARVLPS